MMEYKSKKLIEKLNTTAKSGKGGLLPSSEKQYESNKKRWTISGIIIGLVVGVPLGALVELWKFITSGTVDDFLTGILIALGILVIAIIGGYVYGSYLDGNS